jgi:hypothetical protein
MQAGVDRLSSWTPQVVARTHTRKIDNFIAIPFLYVIYHYYHYVLSTKSTSAYCLIIYFSVGHLYRQSLTIKKKWTRNYLFIELEKKFPFPSMFLFFQIYFLILYLFFIGLCNSFYDIDCWLIRLTYSF